MRKSSILLLALAALSLLAASLRADVLVKSETSRVYMDSERKQSSELWLAPGMSAQKSGNRLNIMREDLNKWWIVDLGRKVYQEFPLKDSQPMAAPAKPDIHYLWLNYEPQYEWKISDSGEHQNINGRPCHRYDVEAAADFAELSGQYWLTDAAAVPGSKAYREYLIKQLTGDADRAGLLKLLAEHPEGVPLFREEVIEHSIAPVIRQTNRVLSIEEATPPAGTYDLPTGLKKIGD